MSDFVHEIQIKSSGFPGAPGYTNLYFATDVAADHDPQFGAVHTFLQTIRNNFPSTWSGQINSVGRLLEMNTGVLGGFTTAPTVDTAVVDGASGGGYGAGVAGAVISWATATINRGRLVRGRTFLVPVAAGTYDADGTLTTPGISNIQTAANTLISSATGFCIWSRPRLGAGGLAAPVLTAHINDRAAFLSSRRA